MTTIEMFREQLETLGAIRYKIPPELCRKIVRQAKKARQCGINPKKIISQELQKIDLTSNQS